MDRIRWIEKSIPFRDIVDNPAIQKPVLVQIGTKPIVVGEKINGEFIAASPYKVSGNRFDVMEQEIVLSSKHTGIWRVISRTTSKNESYIHRLTTKDIERIYKQDFKNERLTSRSYICTKDIEAFDVHLHPNDPTIVNGQRGERRKKYIEDNVGFIINDIGEVEYTPTEGERTSQDYLTVPKNKQGALLQILIPGLHGTEQLIRNRVVRTLFCTTKNEPTKRRFLLEVNEQPCDIRPIASEGSTELRYLHSTQNLYDYMLTYGNDTSLYVKLVRGDPPIKSIEFDGYLVLKTVLNGERIPMCRVEDLEVALATLDLPIKVKLPTGDHTWRSLAECRAAEIQCIQLSLALLARHESEIYVTIEGDRNTLFYLQSNSNHEERSLNSRQISDTIKKHIEECEETFNNHQSSISKRQNDVRSGQTKPKRNVSGDEKKNSHPQTPKLSRALPLSHPVSDKLYRDDEKRVAQDNLKTDRHRHNKEKNLIKHSERSFEINQ